MICFLASGGCSPELNAGRFFDTLQRADRQILHGVRDSDLPRLCFVLEMHMATCLTYAIPTIAP
jgi:hypothetical protein